MVRNLFRLPLALVGAVALFAMQGCAETGKPVASAKSGNTEHYHVVSPAVTPGVEVLFQDPKYFSLIKGKKVGLITNPTGVDHTLESTIDLLFANKDVKLIRLYAPEHGVRGDAYAGEKVGNEVDKKTGVSVISVYGMKGHRPDDAALKDVDVMIYDIQDVGSRSYTYIYSMALAMEECGKRKIPFIVLDRPNPSGAHIVDGNILNEKEYSTFVGMFAIPYQYGMTPGETAQLFNNEFNKTKCDLTVVPMKGYKRNMMQWDTGLPFVPSSTHIPSAKHAVYYNLTGILGEIPAVSIGVGYTLPFECVAAPWIDPNKFTEELRKENLPGLAFRPISFRPSYSRFSAQATVDKKPQMANGVHIIITDYDAVRPVTAQAHIMAVLQRLYPEQGVFSDEKAKKCLFDEVNGTDQVRKDLLAGKTGDQITADWPRQRAEFELKRQKYLIYK